MRSPLCVSAGRLALEKVRSSGLPQHSIKVMAGASGGPKWFVLSGLDKVLLTEYFRDRQTPLDLLGTSAGSWRFSCFCQNDPLAAHQRFEQGYLLTRYSENPDIHEISCKARELVESMIGPNGTEEILNNQVMRFNLIVVRSHGLLSSERRPVQMTGLGMAATANLVNRKLLSYFFTRTLFYHPAYEQSEKPDFFHLNDLPTDRVRLSSDNLVSAVMASGSIPAVMEGVSDIKGAPEGIYRDGGITDYHFDLPLHKGDGLVLYPHFYNRMIPGWFDKALKKRRPALENTDNIVLISPSSEFVASLPYGKIPDRNDFQRCSFEERVRYWERVIRESERLGDCFLELVNSGRIQEVVKPL
ncbi:MAG: patatin-like phospholipase family protein [Endozoicomonas sp.]